MQESKASRLFLLSSIMLGALAAVVSFAYLDKATGEDRGPKTKVLVAKVDLRENTPLDPEKDLEEMEIPKNMVCLGRGRCNRSRRVPIRGNASIGASWRARRSCWRI